MSKRVSVAMPPEARRAVEMERSWVVVVVRVVILIVMWWWVVVSVM